MKAYNSTYINSAMTCLGEMMDYGVNECGIDPAKFFQNFIGLGYASAFESGNPKYVVGMSGQELAQRIIDESKIPTNPFSEVDYPGIYWCGWILAYYQWCTAMPFSDIIGYLGWDYLLSAYPALHTASEDKAVSTFSKIIKQEQTASRIQTARLNFGYSQSQLAAVSEINLRTLQEYENKRRNINRASADVLLRLARALGCRIEDIMEYEI